MRLQEQQELVRVQEPVHTVEQPAAEPKTRSSAVPLELAQPVVPTQQNLVGRPGLQEERRAPEPGQLHTAELLELALVA